MRGTISPNIALLLVSLMPAAVCAASEYGEPGNIDKGWYEQLNEAAGRPIDKIAKAYAAMVKAGYVRDVVEDGCGCKVDASGRISDPVHCTPVFRSGREDQARAIAVELIPPISWAASLQCFSRGAPSCRGVKGAPVIGETCCEMVDRGYSKIQNDANMYVLLPAPVASQLAGYTFGITRSGEKLDASCRVEIDRDRHVWSFGSGSVGFFARTWLYAARHYGARLPEPIGSLLRMSAAEPPGRWETARALAIGEVQGGRTQDVTVETAERARR